MLADAAAMGAAKSDLMNKLQSRADAAKAFEAKAAPCLATVGAAACAAIVGAEASTDLNRAAVTAGVNTEAAVPTIKGDTTSAQTRVSLAALESLVQEGQGIGIKLDSLTDLTRLLNTARAWSQQAEFCLTGKEPQTTKHKKQHQRPSLEKVITLVHELQSMAVVLPHAEELCSKQQQAEHWVGRARQVLEQGNLGQNLPDVQALVDQGFAFGLEMPELTQLTALVKAIEWNSRVRMALRLPDELPHSQHPGGTAAQCAQQMPGLQSDIHHQVNTQSQLQVEGSQINRGSPVPAGPPVDPPTPTSSAQTAEFTTAVTPPPAQPPLPQVDNAPSTSQQTAAIALGESEARLQPGQGPQQRILVADRLRLAEAEELFLQGGELPVEEPLLQHLQKLMASGQQWEAQVIPAHAAFLLYSTVNVQQCY